MAVDLLQCPDHPGRLLADPSALRCAVCGPLARMGEDRILCTTVPSAAPLSPVDRLMQNTAVARVYERWWRPFLIRVVSSLSYRAEDALVDRHATARDPERILELCCGTARATRRLLAGGRQALGVDLSLPMLREARRQGGDGLVLLHADVQRAFARADTFDLAMCLAALHLLDRPAAALAHVAQALRRGGVFVGWALTATGPLGIASRAGVARPLGLRLFSPGTLRRLTEASGLHCVESTTLGAIELIAAERP